MYPCSSRSGVSARIRGGWSLKAWVAPDYTLIATLPLASGLPLQSASLGLYMCVGHNLCSGGPCTGRTFCCIFCCRKVGHAIRSRDQITGLGRCSAQLLQHHQWTSLRCSGVFPASASLVRVLIALVTMVTPVGRKAAFPCDLTNQE